mmetsp:Transcript_89512/g.200277  ORF Transcript_89512/g.200277 Transcript_89512/m.200277 type:complete len:231 (+) Transcript_89512:552-1244(+)
MAVRPVWGSSMVVVSASISPLRVMIWLFFSCSSLVFVVLSELHQASWSSSACSSAAIRSIIFWISVSATVNGLPDARSAMALASVTDLPNFAAFRSKACASRLCVSCATKPRRGRCFLDLAWRRAVGPLFVAATVPKVWKAASLFRIAMASEMAASSCVLSSVRSSYSCAFWVQMASNESRKFSDSSFCLCASANRPFFVARSPSLPLSDACFSWKRPSILECAFVMVDM